MGKRKNKKNNTMRAIFLPEFAQKKLHVNPGDDVVVVIEDDKVVIKNQVAHAFEEINEIIKDDYAKLGVVDAETANDHLMKFRYGEEN